MNKDRAIEIFENIRNDDNILHFTHEEHLQAIDYAIEQMENDNLLERLENGECCKHSSNKVVAYNREWLEDNLEMEFDLLKFARDTTSKMSDDEIAERLSKVVEPYVRSTDD